MVPLKNTTRPTKNKPVTLDWDKPNENTVAKNQEGV